MKPSEFTLAAGIRPVPSRNEWIAMVGVQVHATHAMEVRAVGIEDTQEHALMWVQETIRLMREHNRFDVQAQDYFDRMGIPAHERPTYSRLPGL